MAGDWIKMRADLFTHPKVVRISSALKADTLRTVGGLMSAWCLFDAHSVDGILVGYTPETLDNHLRWPGFSAAMIGVGWLIDQDGESLQLPDFEEHNGQSAKRRAQDADRKKAVRETSASDADKMRTREEKRREEKKEQKKEPAAPKPKKSPKPEQTFATWVDSLGDAVTIPENDPVFEYAAKVGLPPDFVALAWSWFDTTYGEGGDRQTKTYADWRAVFRKAVAGGWPKYWAINRQGEYYLTTEGVQAQRAQA